MKTVSVQRVRNGIGPVRHLDFHCWPLYRRWVNALAIRRCCCPVPVWHAPCQGRRSVLLSYGASWEFVDCGNDMLMQRLLEGPSQRGFEGHESIHVPHTMPNMAGAKAERRWRHEHSSRGSRCLCRVGLHPTGNRDARVYLSNLLAWRSIR